MCLFFQIHFIHQFEEVPLKCLLTVLNFNASTTLIKSHFMLAQQPCHKLYITLTNYFYLKYSNVMFAVLLVTLKIM